MPGLTALTDAEYAAILAAFSGNQRIRNRTIFQVGVATGLRISELLSLTIHDVAVAGITIRDQVEVSARHVKGKKESRVIALSPDCRDALALWLAHLRARPGFGSARPLWPILVTLWEPVQHGIVRRAIARAAAAAGITHRVSTHTMRKTLAAAVYNATGKDIRMTQLALGHRSIGSTAHYLAGDQRAANKIVATLRFGATGEPINAQAQDPQLEFPNIVLLHAEGTRGPLAMQRKNP